MPTPGHEAVQRSPELEDCESMHHAIFLDMWFLMSSEYLSADEKKLRYMGTPPMAAGDRHMLEEIRTLGGRLFGEGGTLRRWHI